ncbi:restriction endonuclease subunit S [Chloroflexus sp. MS-CIW-1]|uniref:restriction endonuclease subunit S n=1 Tax=Chloroflexus sp. MS-CIW-1 TaxID=3055768 RepID=UPI002648A54D|nr:restriction endonuclease subunit S [Chloroflexus sp. MS-CIW-1]MDN5271899.1 restriction endonuclease subunit S [Chloroflexus sp. MS-CIW-1]
MKRKEISTTENTERTEVDAVASGHSVVNTEDLPDGFQMTELGPLPKEWRVVRLGEVVEKPQYGFTAAAQRDPVGPKMLRITDIQDGNVNWNAVPYCECGNDDIPKYLLEAGDILFARTGSVGKAFLVSSVPEPSIFASYLIRVRVDRTRLDPQFAFLFMQSAAYWSQIASQTHGAVQPNINATQLKSLLLPLPPLPEQRAIAHVLRTVQRAKEATEGVIAALKELKKSLMQHLFTYGPVPVTEREQVELQESEIGLLPSHWRVVRLGEVAKLRTGPFGSLLHASDYVEGGIPFVMPKDLSSTGQIIPHSIARIKQDDRNRLNNYLLQVGDIILGRRGEIGRRALVTKKEEGWVCGSGCLRIRPNDKLYPLYLSYLFEIEVVRCYLSSEAIGTTMANLNTQILSRLPIPLPPLDEQREIARILQAVDTRIAAEQARRTALEELFKSLLHELMSGQIRLPNIVGGERSCDSAPDADKLPKSED